MESIIVLSVIILAIAGVELPFIINLIYTPKNLYYLGTVHWPGDYFYYLSQFAQGKYSWFGSFDLYDGGSRQKTAVGFVNVILGKAVSILYINQIWAYHLSTIIFVFLFLYLGYLLIAFTFPEKDSSGFLKRIFAFLIFIFANSTPRWVIENGKKSVSYYDYWFNNGLPFNRLNNVPHQLLARAIVLLVIYFSLKWWKTKDRKNTILSVIIFLISGFILAGTEPVYFCLTLLVIFMVSLFISGSVFNLKKFVPFILFFLSGLPFIFYLKALFLTPPYSNLATWELTQTLNVGIWGLILANGPVMGLGIIGAVVSIRQKSAAKTTAVIFSALSILLFLSPVPYYLRIVNARFLPAATTLFLSILATEALVFISIHTGKYRKIFLVSVAVCLLIISIMPLIKQIGEKTKRDYGNSYFYLDKRVIDVFNVSEKSSRPGDLFLVIWPFNLPFPAITARHTYFGHPLLTIDNDRKEKETFDFFSEKEREDEMEEFLLKNKINYVIAYSGMRKTASLKPLIGIYNNGFLVLYKVRKEESGQL